MLWEWAKQQAAHRRVGGLDDSGFTADPRRAHVVERKVVLGGDTGLGLVAIPVLSLKLQATGRKGEPLVQTQVRVVAASSE